MEAKLRNTTTFRRVMCAGTKGLEGCGPGVLDGVLCTARVRLGSVLGQGDAEIKLVHVAELRSPLIQWKVRLNSGEDPAPDEEVTGDQLSALA